ncbi:MAG TPA: beta-galactosidase trimerization domain-containing protein, partial [Spirochaetia bacterium]|nr:beta-galactosidase trimerization domain-containing protein [Spirochaetia bacterium]
TLFVPMALCLDDRERAALRAFAEAGGLLVGEAATGMYDSGGALDPDSRALADLFGVRHVELEALPDWGFTEALGDGFSFGGAQYRRVVEPGPGTEVLARFPDGRPAATGRALGAGRAVYVATFAALAFHLRGDPGTRNFLAGFLDPAGYPQLRRLAVLPGEEPERAEGAAAAPSSAATRAAAVSASSAPAAAPGAPAAPAAFVPSAVVRLLETPEDWVLVAVNHREGPARIELDFDSALVREASASLTVPGGSGTVRYFRKAGRT